MDTYENYINSIKSFKRISPKRELELARIIFYSRNPSHIQKAKEELIQANLFLVVSRALKLQCQNYSSDIMDLISVGNKALVCASESYRNNHKTSAKFSSYAIVAIDREIINYLNSNHLIYLPWQVSKHCSDIKKLKQEYKDKLTDEIIIKNLKIGKKILKDIQNFRHVLMVEDVFKKDCDGANWQEKIKDDSLKDPANNFSRMELSHYLTKYILALSDRERFVIREKYFNDKENIVIAENLKVSRQRINHIDKSALRKLRCLLIRDYNVYHPDRIHLDGVNRSTRILNDINNKKQYREVIGEFSCE